MWSISEKVTVIIYHSRACRKWRTDIAFATLSVFGNILWKYVIGGWERIPGDDDDIKEKESTNWKTVIGIIIDIRIRLGGDEWLPVRESFPAFGCWFCRRKLLYLRGIEAMFQSPMGKLFSLFLRCRLNRSYFHIALSPSLWIFFW
jgi:hypothetical protein